MSNKLLRNITKVFTSAQHDHSANAKMRKIIGDQNCKKLDPFLMLDYFEVKLPGGFPDHPHRGFETVTYILDGKVLHEDFKGNKGSLESGGVQWMTAGKGIVHCEMPGSFDKIAVGFQLWINLEKKDKMCDPQYQQYQADKLPIVQSQGVWIRLIAGEALGQQGPIYTRTPTYFLDVRLEKNVKFDQHIPSDFQGMIFLYEGSLVAGKNAQKVGDKQVALFEPEQGENLNIISGNSGAKFILIAGRPIKESVYSYGPFVLDSQQSLNDTFEDYQQEKNGFEGAGGWQSEIQFLGQLNKQ